MCWSKGFIGKYTDWGEPRKCVCGGERPSWALAVDCDEERRALNASIESIRHSSKLKINRKEYVLSILSILWAGRCGCSVIYSEN